jgi:hypothetical protein
MIDLIKLSTYLDGGTIVWIDPNVKMNVKTIEEAQNCQKYYLDNRMDSTTKGELYDKYPSHINAKILDKSKFNFI